MQVLSANKRDAILSAAAALFAARPFHKVLLSDVARAASVGKGTLYIYFNSKEHLYMSVLYQGFSDLVERLEDQLETNRLDSYAHIQMVIRELVAYAYEYPQFFKIMRTGRMQEKKQSEWKGKREELYKLMQSVIERGVAGGLFEDPHPEITARLIPGLVRSALLDGTDKIDSKTLYDHIIRFIGSGLMRKSES